MSTRCNIIINTRGSVQEFQVYHHCDGYPEGVGSEVRAVARAYRGGRNCEDFAKALNEYNKAYKLEGYEHGLHTDIEYLYFVEISDKAIEVAGYSVTWDFKADIREQHPDRDFTAEEVWMSQKNERVFHEIYPASQTEVNVADAVAEAVAGVTPAAFDDAELIAELKRRGYTGTISKTITATL